VLVPEGADQINRVNRWGHSASFLWR
jgi:hypothetical protein